VGTYHLFCAEYCGTKHSAMIGEVVVQDPAEYQAWLDARPARNPIETGSILYQNLRCDTCHLPGPGARAPVLAGRFGQLVPLADGQRVLFDEAYLRASLFEPLEQISAGFPADMPSYRGQIGEEDVLALIAYLKSTGAEPGSAPR
jgi:cytochrome c oxidase subunit 2